MRARCRNSSGSARVDSVCEPLEDAGCVNAFSTRLGGVSPAFELNNLPSQRCKRRSLRNRAAFWKRSEQDHSRSLPAAEASMSALDRPAGHVSGPQTDCDAMITRNDGGLRSADADCLPVMIADTDRRMAAIRGGAHGGDVESTVAGLMLLRRGIPD